ncbi:putative HVA22-like protein g isoform X1 [Phoenix dactylifera]|uniref:HVA22-like protein n=1 Tax=Phoenix dactylifera TaxID=42345 RepID=A0A8B7CHN3_PHODC|nr:putative HVA22-like protein g isoform X1 [Phoenix dactylifera]
MMGSFLTRAFVMILGYAYPAYECYKTVELNKPEIERLQFWCQYWILVAAMTVFERVGDTFISWLPLYSEAKLAFFVYLWYPKTKGTTYVYDTFVRPYVAKHETEIDRNLLELRTRAGNILVIYWQKAWSCGQTRFFEILHFVASQSQAPRTRPVQQQQQSQKIHQSPSGAPARRPAAFQQPQQPARAPPSPNKNQQQEQPTKAGGLSPVASRAKPQASSAPSPAVSGTASRPSPSKEEPMLVDAATSTAKKDSNPPPQETATEAIRMTRSRLKKRAAIGR